MNLLSITTLKKNTRGGTTGRSSFLMAMILLGAITLSAALFFDTQLAAGSVGAQSSLPANYDADGDGLIEISSLAQLNAMRWDANGDGVPSEGNEDAYSTAFPVSDGGSVCPTSATCEGYELTADLDFDENHDGEITSADAAYWNGGVGWQPMDYGAIFDGNGNTISNLYINAPDSTTDVGLFGQLGSNSEVRRLGLVDADVNYYLIDVAGGSAGALAGKNDGRIVGCYVTGSISGASMAPLARSYRGRPYGGIGLLAGVNRGSIAVSYADGSVNESHTRIEFLSRQWVWGTGPGWKNTAGGLVGENHGSIAASYATGSINYDGDTYFTLGGLVGRQTEGAIIASYGDSDINISADSWGYGWTYVGSLFGRTIRGSIIAGYGAGATFSTIGAPGTEYAYDLWDNLPDTGVSLINTYIQQCTTESGWYPPSITHCADISTDFLKEPTGYTGPFAEWNVDIDNADGDDDPSTGGDDPWNFGGSDDYPTLNMRQLEALFITDPPPSFGDARHFDYYWHQNQHNGRLDLPKATGGVAPLTYTVSPDLPPGLVFDPGYLTIDGMPTETQERVHYAYTVTDANGKTASLSFSILVAPDPTPPVVPETVTGDRAALIALYEATGGDSWTNNANWLSDEPLNQWHGVTVNDEGQVTHLSLRNNNLSGSLPADLGNLTHLQVLSLDRNSLSGSLPTQLGNLSNLIRLAMNRNQLTGAIPSELGNLSNLSIIGLARNKLSGNLPTELGNLSGLTKVSLHDNTALSGALPSGFTDIGSLQRLAIANTGICIPAGDAFSDWLGTVADKPGIDGLATCQ